MSVFGDETRVGAAPTLIRTKLQRPIIGPDILQRPHLIERLEEGRHRKLTLIAAPAGYGKSILASIWANECGCPVAWLSLDKNDNDLVVFLSYFVAAIQTLFPDTCQKIKALLDAKQEPPLDYLTTALVNDTVVLPDPFTLVLDDYHLIKNPDIQQLVSDLIQYQSDRMHLVLLTRQDPLLGLPKLRAKNQLTEIRSDALAFTDEETRLFLVNACGGEVGDDLVALLFERTEGWPAGLRLACLALPEQGDSARFLEELHGSSQHVMSYLLEEVFLRQSNAIQNFLLRTAVLDRFCAPLCDALPSEVTNAEPFMTSQEIINRLIQSNLFVIPLDHQGEWYRYHHLFQELLEHRLQAEFTQSQIAVLNTAASIWLDGNGYVESALDHALAAGDLVLIAQMVENHRHEMMDQEQWPRLNRWLSRLPQELVEERIPLLLTKAWYLGTLFMFAEVVPILDQIKTILDQDDHSLTMRQRSVWAGEVAVIEASMLYYMAQGQASLELMSQGLDVTSSVHAWVVGNARFHQIAAYQSLGQLDKAYRELHKAQVESGRYGAVFTAQIHISHLTIAVLSGNLRGAEEAATQLVDMARSANLYEALGWGLQTLGYISYQWNDLEAAERYFSKVLELRYRSAPVGQAHSTFGLALTYQALGRHDQATQLAEEAIEWAKESGNPELLLEAYSFTSRLALVEGQVPNTESWTPFLDNTFTVMLLVEIPHLTRAATLIVQGTSASLEDATALLNQLHQFVEETHNTWRLIEVLSLQALLYDTQGLREAALDLLEKAMVLAEPGGYIRLFVDLGQQMAGLLAELKPNDKQIRRYVNQILGAFEKDEGGKRMAEEDHILPVGAAEDRPRSFIPQPLIEPLTSRELDVLQLLAQHLTDREIALQLAISPHTVNFHLKNIYAKLDVHDRRQAKKRAQELGLLPTY